MYTLKRVVCLARCGHKKSRPVGFDAYLRKGKTCVGTGFKNSILLDERMNPIGFLDSTRMIAIRLDHLLNHLLSETTLQNFID